AVKRLTTSRPIATMIREQRRLEVRGYGQQYSIVAGGPRLPFRASARTRQHGLSPRALASLWRSATGPKSKVQSPKSKSRLRTERRVESPNYGSAGCGRLLIGQVYACEQAER